MNRACVQLSGESAGLLESEVGLVAAPTAAAATATTAATTATTAKAASTAGSTKYLLINEDNYARC